MLIKIEFELSVPDDTQAIHEWFIGTLDPKLVDQHTFNALARNAIYSYIDRERSMFNGHREVEERKERSKS